MKVEITFKINSDDVSSFSDDYLAKLWYIAQANRAPIEDPDAGEIVEHIGREIISRWVKRQGVPLWDHQGRHAACCELDDLKLHAAEN